MTKEEILMHNLFVKMQEEKMFDGMFREFVRKGVME